MTENKLRKIYEFLLENQSFNKDFQEHHYRSVIESRDTISGKVILLLYRTADTQSQPRIDPLSQFHRLLHNNRRKLRSFKGLIGVLTEGQECDPSYCNLYTALKAHDGWGEKTAALFTKSIFHLHNGGYARSLKIWHDAPDHISEGDRLYLPVDVVIKTVFREMGMERPSFASINNLLAESYTGDQIALWDDLWFWGSFTQNGQGSYRVVEWNENKYWCQEGTNKNLEYVRGVKSRAQKFISLIQNRT